MAKYKGFITTRLLLVYYKYDDVDIVRINVIKNHLTLQNKNIIMTNIIHGVDDTNAELGLFCLRIKFSY